MIQKAAETVVARLPDYVTKFIEAHRSAIYPRKLLEPGWGGHLTDEEVAYIQFHLLRDDKLAFKWGFRPAQKSRPEEAIRRVAVNGDPDIRKVNIALARPRKRPALAPVTDLGKLKNPCQGVGPRTTTALTW